MDWITTVFFFKSRKKFANDKNLSWAIAMTRNFQNHRACNYCRWWIFESASLIFLRRYMFECQRLPGKKEVSAPIALQEQLWESMMFFYFLQSCVLPFTCIRTLLLEDWSVKEKEQSTCCAAVSMFNVKKGGFFRVQTFPIVLTFNDSSDSVYGYNFLARLFLRCEMWVDQWSTNYPV